ncbi:MULTISPECIES: acyl-CoA synthetase [Protofrankia]|uniref:Long-chain-fatty-acid--CoA ligase n=1 Tax=Candidatus Protofrankia datiscae TaxID=2716812 RepID=F8AXI7_9ACTN|nr:MULTISPECIES: acyl-CoA synthetase [Protofrankia]AEH09474.1 Long-chain-fatty-acid--CoA ligase [Candidatus Protofrankia datiscae]
MSDIDITRRHSLGDIPRRTAQRFPGKPAIIDGATTLTFAEFEATVERTAAAIAAAGLAKGDRLALLSHNCWQFAVLDFAAARVGVILVPVNFMLGANEIAFILDQSGAKGFVVEAALLPVAEKALGQLDGTQSAVEVRVVIPLQGKPVPAGWSGVAGWTSYDGTAPDVPVADDDPVRIMFTSGTESRPKGTLLSSRSLMWHYVSCVVGGGMTADDVELHTLPLYHCAQLDCFLGVDVYLGATSIILPTPDPGTVLRAIEEYRVKKYFAPPTVWIGLLRSPDFGTRDLSSLRKGYYGASPMPVAVLEEMRQRLPDIRLWNFYGQTEIAPLGTLLGPEDQVSHAGSAGRAALNVETRIVDDDDSPVPAGTIGEIVHRTPHATLGYYQQPEKTAEAFRNGWFHSGDLGYLTEDGYLYVVDRKKDMIKTGGENVATREVEEVIYTLDGVAEVAVFAVPHPRWVEAVTAVVVPKPGVTLTPKQVSEYARTRLAGFKTPKYVVVADALPKNPSGKILKRQLRDEYAHLADHETTADASSRPHRNARPTRG